MGTCSYENCRMKVKGQVKWSWLFVFIYKVYVHVQGLVLVGVSSL